MSGKSPQTDNADLRAAAQRAEDYLGWLERDDPAERSLFTEPGNLEDFHALASPDRILALCEELERKTAGLERIATAMELGTYGVSREDIAAVARAALEGKPTE